MTTDKTQNAGVATDSARTSGSALDLSRLRVPQQHLYRLIKRCCDENRFVKRSEYVEIYERYACRGRKRWCKTVDMATGESKIESWDIGDHWVKELADGWFIRNVGILVSRGYLLVVPMVLEDD